MEDRFIKADFPVTLTFDTVKEKLLLVDEEDIALVHSLYQKAIELARPKALYRICSIGEIDGSNVTINGVTFTSAALAKNLTGTNRVFAYIVTCGTEVDVWSRQEKDYFISLWLDMIKEMILADANIQFIDYLLKTYDIEKYATMNPGSGDASVWPLAQQLPLFELIGDVEHGCGVTMQNGFLMWPTKSVSGILFPSDQGYVNCILCQRETCPNRQVPYNPKILYA